MNNSSLLRSVILTLMLSAGNNLFSQCELLCNMDFEEEQIASGSSVMVSQTDISCWNTTASDGLIEVWGTGFNGVPSYSGSQFIEINANEASTLFQDFLSAPNGTVTIGFAHRGRMGTDVMNVAIGPVGGPYTNLGNFSDGTTAWGHHQVTFTFPAGTPTMYSLRFTAVSSVGGASLGNFLDAVSIDLDASQNPVFSPIATFLCIGAPAPVLPTTSNNGISGVWQPATISTATPGVTTYSFTPDNLPLCPDAPVEFVVTIVSDPDIAAPAPVTACNFYVLPAITGTNLSGNEKYYTGPNGTGTVLNPGATINTSQNLYIYGGATGCSDEEQLQITIQTNPVITVSPNDTVCAGEAGNLVASSTTPGLTYTWNPGGITGSTLTASPASTTVYSVSGTSAAGCTSNIVSRFMIVRPTPVAGIALNGPNPVCEGASTILNGSSSTTPVSYSWSTGETTPAITVTAASPSASYTLTVTSPNGCSGDSTVTIAVIPQLEVTITGEPSFCEGSQTNLAVTGNIPGMTFEWSPTGETTTQVEVTEAGWVVVTGELQQCGQAKDSVLVVENPNPSVTVPDDMEICPGETVTVSVGSDQQGSTFSWMPGNLTGSTNTLTTNGTVVYTLTAQNGNCVSEPNQFTINASAACYLAIPNIFTPNGDNVNDFFQLTNYSGLNSLECVITNRWGITVAVFDTPDFKWNGKDSSGNEYSEGVYFYQIKAVTKAQETLEESGHVTLIRSHGK